MKKKLLLTAIMVSTFLVGTNAQSVISNDDGLPITSTDENGNNENEREIKDFINLVYYGFDGFQNYGISNYYLNPNNIGYEINLRMNLESYGNGNIELGPNCSFKLWGQANMKLLLTAAVGPSFRIQNVPEISYDSKGWKKEESKTVYKLDLFANARLSFVMGHLSLSAGYFLWGAEFKFSEGYKSQGFNAAIGWGI